MEGEQLNSSSKDTINHNENTENVATENNSKKKKRSDVWPHFTIVSVLEKDVQTEYAQCNYCPSKYKVAGKSNAGTGNLRIHLQKHPDRYVQNVEKRAEESFVFSQEKFREALLQWVVIEDQPFTAVQEKAFLRLLETLNPEASSVSDKTIRRDMMAAFLHELEINKLRFKNLPGKVSFTIDGWTSKNVLCFVAIRAHFITAEWKYESLLLDFIEVDGHKGLDLKATFLACLQRYEIPLSKVMAITLDNVESNHTFMVLLEKHGIELQIIISSSGNRIRCMAHILNLAVQDIMNSLSISLTSATDTSDDEIILPDEENEYENVDLTAEDEADDDSCEFGDQSFSAFTVAKLRKLVKKIRKSDLKRKQLRKMCELCSVKYLAPIIDVSTRWNSTFQMLERASKLKKPLLALCSSVKSLRQFIITEGEWSELDKLFSLLKKFDRSTKLVSMERHPTISAYLPTLNWLLDSIKSFIRDNPGQLADAATNGLRKLEKYEDKLDIENSLLPFVAVFMNPALKLNYFKEHKYRNIKDIQKRITEIFERDYAATTETTDPNEQEQLDDDFYSHMYKRSKQSKATKEIQKYLQFPLSSSKIDLLEFWRSQEGEFPGLSRLARDILPIQSSSVAVERDFSSASDVVTTKQCALKAETIRAKMCLKMWYKSRLDEIASQKSDNSKPTDRNQ